MDCFRNHNRFACSDIFGNSYFSARNTTLKIRFRIRFDNSTYFASPDPGFFVFHPVMFRRDLTAILQLLPAAQTIPIPRIACFRARRFFMVSFFRSAFMMTRINRYCFRFRPSTDSTDKLYLSFCMTACCRDYRSFVPSMTSWPSFRPPAVYTGFGFNTRCFLPVMFLGWNHVPAFDYFSAAFAILVPAIAFLCTRRFSLIPEFLFTIMFGRIRRDCLFPCCSAVYTDILHGSGRNTGGFCRYRSFAPSVPRRLSFCFPATQTCFRLRTGWLFPVMAKRFSPCLTTVTGFRFSTGGWFPLMMMFSTIRAIIPKGRINTSSAGGTNPISICKSSEHYHYKKK